jgi:hypothetical protein
MDEDLQSSMSRRYHIQQGDPETVRGVEGRNSCQCVRASPPSSLIPGDGQGHVCECDDCCCLGRGEQFYSDGRVKSPPPVSRIPGVHQTTYAKVLALII